MDSQFYSKYMSILILVLHYLIFIVSYLFIYLFMVLGFELRAYTLSHSTSPFL
jgi:hypothetical protein